MPRDLAETDSINSRQLVVNGEATGSQVDYMVALGYPFYEGDVLKHVVLGCHGTLIAPTVVLTSALCTDYNQDVFVNMYNKTNLADVDAFDFGADDYVRHPGWDYFTFENNVALIFLPREVKNADTIQYAQLNEESNVPEDGDPLSVMGWGRGTSYLPMGDFRDVLLQAEVNYAANKDCLATWMVGNTNTNGMMCIEDGRRAACNYDEGGPLMLNNTNSNLRTNPIQVGIESYSGCNSISFPDVYTRVSYYADWIKETACERADEFCSPSSKPSVSPSPSLAPSASLSPSLSPSTSIHPTSKSKKKKRTKAAA